VASVLSIPTFVQSKPQSDTNVGIGTLAALRGTTSLGHPAARAQA
jgi:hypothetical protein